MLQNGYMPAERPSEVFLTNAQMGDYSKMKSEILIPVTKVAELKWSGCVLLVWTLFLQSIYTLPAEF